MSIRIGTTFLASRCSRSTVLMCIKVGSRRRFRLTPGPAFSFTASVIHPQDGNQFPPRHSPHFWIIWKRSRPKAYGLPRSGKLLHICERNAFLKAPSHWSAAANRNSRGMCPHRSRAEWCSRSRSPGAGCVSTRTVASSGPAKQESTLSHLMRASWSCEVHCEPALRAIAREGRTPGDKQDLEEHSPCRCAGRGYL